MTLTAEVQLIQSDLSDRTITLNLTLQDFNAVALRSCEIRGAGFRNRISFAETKMVEEVFVARLANSIKECLRSVPSGTQVLSMPDFLVELPGLALYGAHLMILDAKDGVRNAILRFKEFLGAVNNAFVINIGFRETGTSYCEKLAVNVLADVCLPILNLCRSFEELKFEGDKGRISSLSDRMREFEFQTELLKRFIHNAVVGQEDQNTRYIGSEDTRPTRKLTNGC